MTLVLNSSVAGPGPPLATAPLYCCLGGGPEFLRTAPDTPERPWTFDRPDTQDTPDKALKIPGYVV